MVIFWVIIEEKKHWNYVQIYNTTAEINGTNREKNAVRKQSSLQIFRGKSKNYKQYEVPLTFHLAFFFSAVAWDMRVETGNV